MNSITIRSYKDLIVWQKAMELVENVYLLTKDFPESEKYGLVSQMRRCSVSIPSNIAEGRSRGTREDYRRFLIMSLGSVTELETQIEISKRLGFINDSKLVDELIIEIIKILKTIIRKL